jgi:hypothetical protein
MPRVLVGAAHTLESPGQIFRDLREADLTRKLLKLVVPHLEKTGIEFKTVPLDLPLLDRIEWINNTGYTEANGDVFIELHINDGNKRGIEAWYKGTAAPDNKSQILSEKVVEVLCKETGYTKQGVKSEHEHELGSLLILNQINCIGTTLETLYIDNEEDIAILKDDAKFDDLAKAIVKGIEEYIKNPPTQSSTTTVPVQNTPLFPPAPQKPITPFPAPASPGFGGGFGGASSAPAFGSKPFGSGFGATPPAATGSSNIMDREERKKMITETYKKILGKEPAQNDLNYYLNMGISQDELYKKLCDSPDHEQMVKDAKEFKESKDKLLKTESQAQQAESKVKDLNTMMENFNKLLHQKNIYIAQLQNELVQHNIIKNGQYYHLKPGQPLPSIPQQAPNR